MNLRASSHIIATVLAFAAFAFPAQAEKIGPGHSAMWIDPDRNGEGWIVEILPDDNAALYWYTSDEEGKPRWIISLGEIVHSEDDNHDRIVFSELLTGHGGRFAPGIPPEDVTLDVVGTAEIEFYDCNAGQIAFEAYGVSRTYPLTRLTHTLEAGCSATPPPDGDPESLIRPDPGTSGTWFDPESQGGPVFTLQWLADGGAILFWFAYDAEGNPFWAAGLGHLEGDLLVFPQLDYVSGGRFGEDYPPEEAELIPWGQLVMTVSCDTAHVEYEATAEGFDAGSFQLTPLTRLLKPGCPFWTPPTTD